MPDLVLSQERPETFHRRSLVSFCGGWSIASHPSIIGDVRLSSKAHAHSYPSRMFLVGSEFWKFIKYPPPYLYKILCRTQGALRSLLTKSSHSK